MPLVLKQTYIPHLKVLMCGINAFSLKWCGFIDTGMDIRYHTINLGPQTLHVLGLKVEVSSVKKILRKFYRKNLQEIPIFTLPTIVF